MNEVWTDALAMTVVMVAVHVAVGKVMSGRKGYVVDDNQEIYGVGFVLLASGFFPVFPAANGLNRPFVLSECGSSSQVNIITFKNKKLFMLLIVSDIQPCSSPVYFHCFDGICSFILLITSGMSLLTSYVTSVFSVFSV